MSIIYLVVSIVLFLILYQRTEQLSAKVRDLEESMIGNKITPVEPRKPLTSEMERKEPKAVSQPKTPVVESPKKPTVEPPKKKTKDHTEWEMLIGGTWLNRIGAIALVIAIGFFIKYAFDNDWLNETVRVLLGFMLGFMLLGGGAYFHTKKGLPVFSQGLIGSGIAILYLSTYGAFGYYHLVSLPIAYGLMSGITILALWQAVKYNSLAISILGWIGGYLITPFVLPPSTGLAAFLTYVFLLTCGMLLISLRSDRWSLLYYLSLVTHYLIFVYSYDVEHLMVTCSFLVLMWALFFLYDLYLIVKRTEWEVAHAFGGVLNVIGFGAGMYFLLNGKVADWSLAVITAAIGVVYLLPVLFFHARKMIDQVRSFDLGRLALTFLLLITIAIQIQWQGYERIIALSIEMLVFMGIGAKGSFPLFSLFSLVLGGYTGLSLLTQSMVDESQVGLVNMRTVSYLLLSAVFAISAIWFDRSKDPNANASAGLSHIVWSGLLFIWLSIQWQGYNQIIAWSIAVFFLMWLGAKRRISVLAFVALFLGGFTGLSLITQSFSSGAETWFMNLQTGSYLLLAIVFAISAMWYNQSKEPNVKATAPICHVIWAGLLFVWLTIEVNQYFQLQVTSTTSLQFNLQQLVMSVTWLIYSSILFGIGYLRQIQLFRLIAMFLFGLSICKIFLFDFSTLGTLYRIGSFICLGVILLFVSYLYQKRNKNS